MSSPFASLEGAQRLIDWFGIEPSFHDAALLSFELRQGMPSTLKARTFRVGPELDPKGFFVQTKTVEVTFTIYDLEEIDLTEIMEAGIMDGLAVEVSETHTKLAWEASYGVQGHLIAKRVSVAFEPVDW